MSDEKRDFEQAMLYLHRAMRRADVSCPAEVTLTFASSEDRARFEMQLKQDVDLRHTLITQPEGLNFSEMEWYGLKVKMPWPTQRAS